MNWNSIQREKKYEKVLIIRAFSYAYSFHFLVHFLCRTIEKEEKQESEHFERDANLSQMFSFINMMLSSLLTAA